MKLKTKKQVLQEYPQYKTLINAVTNRVGMDSISDIINHGIDGGFNGFIYYVDTHRFAMRHRKAIVNMLSEQAYDLGQAVPEMVAGFGVFRRNPMDEEDRRDLYLYCWGQGVKQGTITNLMAWYAAEEVCRMFEQ
jgi:hypothetical protein